MKVSQKCLRMLIISGLILTAGSLGAIQIIQTQESDVYDGIEVDLTSLKIKNNVITMRFKFRNIGEAEQVITFYFKDCYIMDEANQKKYYVLKDSDGLYIAGPKENHWEGGRFRYRIAPGKSKSMWLKLPEPTDAPESISISVPGVFPFEEIELTK